MIQWGVLHDKYWPILNVIASCNEKEKLSDVKGCTLVCTVIVKDSLCYVSDVSWLGKQKCITIDNTESWKDKWYIIKGYALLLQE